MTALRSIGMKPEKSAQTFNKLLRCPPGEAARQILRRYKKTKRRLLIGNDAKNARFDSAYLTNGLPKVTAFATKLSQRKS